MVLWLIFWLAILAVIPRSFATFDVCNLSGVTMYCTCDPVIDGQTVACFILGPLSPSHDVWSAFADVDDVKALTLHSNTRLDVHIEFIPADALRNLPLLETFSVHEGQLGRLTARTFNNMLNLKTLHLERNEISALDRYSIANLPKLKSLLLSENFLSEILADSLLNLTKLETLCLDRNNISRIESCAFCTLHNLKELELWGNHLTDVTEHMFRGLRYLTRLDMNNNNLRILNDRVFQAMPKLQELDLKDNEIEHLSFRAFYGLEHLQRLNLNGNKLRSLPDDVFSYLPKLMYVDLSFNSLYTIQEAVIQGLLHVKSKYFIFVLRGNPLQCSCDLAWVPKYIKKIKSQELSRDLQNLTCLSDTDTKVLVQTMTFENCDKTSTKKTVTKPETSLPSSVSDSDIFRYSEVHPTSFDDIENSKDSLEDIQMSATEMNEDFDDGDNTACQIIVSYLPFTLVMAYTMFWKTQSL